MWSDRAVLWVGVGTLIVAQVVAAAPSERIEALVERAGNADTDAERGEILRELTALPGLDAGLRGDAERLIREVERYMTDPRLDYFGRSMLREGTYDFGIAEDSPLYPLTRIYFARMHVWVTLEYGGLWSDPERRRERFDEVRPILEELARRYPENRLIRMYLGVPMPPTHEYGAPENAPAWAVHQREGLERLADIIVCWIEHRMQENGEYGGGWGDDCEMWRWWAPVLIGFDDPKITAAQARFSDALLSQEHMRDGYTTRMSDVEHTAEDSADAMTPMMHLDPDGEVWRRRALRLAELMRTQWTGVNERGLLQFKSTYFTVDRVSDDPRQACDTVYHPRAVQPALLLWQRTDDPELGALFTAWMDMWVDATARAERGKPAGIIPSAVHWPGGTIGGLGENWWDPENHTNDPLYVWPSAMTQMLDTLLLTYHMTGDEKYLEPIRSMARIRLEHLKNPPEGAIEPGSKAWCASRMRLLQGTLAKYRLLTGREEFEELIAAERGEYLDYRLTGRMDRLAQALRENAEALRINFEGYTTEVRYTDRVLRFPALFGANTMFAEAVPEIRSPDPGILYQTCTGDPGSVGYFPMNAVRWLTPPREIAALVKEASPEGFAAELFHFGETPRTMQAEFYLLAPGDYVLTLGPADGNAAPVRMALPSDGHRARAAFVLPPQTLCEIRIGPRT